MIGGEKNKKNINMSILYIEIYYIVVYGYKIMVCLML